MRAPAPPYRGEGPHALWHVSEDPSITRFAPHRARTAPADEPLVWAIDTRHLPLYWFPRECPRCTFWASPQTSDADVARFLEKNRELRVHVIEESWIERMRSGRLYVYELPSAAFAEDPDTAGYWLSRETVDPLGCEDVDDLVGRHAAAGIVLRTVADLWPLWTDVLASSLEFSGIRLHNATPST
jgi:uncharacterized protein DUF6886